MCAHARARAVDALRPLRFAKRLWRLAVSGNPLMLEDGARLKLVALLPRVRVLNFERVKQRERREAAERYPELVAAAAESEAAAAAAARAGDAADGGAGSKRKAGADVAANGPVKRTKLTDAQKAKLAVSCAGAVPRAPARLLREICHCKCSRTVRICRSKLHRPRRSRR